MAKSPVLEGFGPRVGIPGVDSKCKPGGKRAVAGGTLRGAASLLQS